MSLVSLSSLSLLLVLLRLVGKSSSAVCVSDDIHTDGLLLPTRGGGGGGRNKRASTTSALLLILSRFPSIQPCCSTTTTNGKCSIKSLPTSYTLLYKQINRCIYIQCHRRIRFPSSYSVGRIICASSLSL